MKIPVQNRIQEHLVKFGPCTPEAIANVLYPIKPGHHRNGKWICGARSVIVRAAKRHGFVYRYVGSPSNGKWLIFPKTGGA